jgi:lambda repressor-like predicted transcriptional regulator
MTGGKGVCIRPNCVRVARISGLCQAHHNVTPHGLVDNEPVRRHIHVLRGRGYGMNAISELSGVTATTLWNVMSGRYETVRYRTSAAVLAVPVPCRIAPGVANVPSVGTVRRIKALARVGFSMMFIADRFGVTVQLLSRMLKQDLVSALWAHRIDVLFEELHMIPGGGPSEVSRLMAAAKGWPAPLEWNEDEIDDPTAQPNTSVEKTPFPVRYEEMRDYLGLSHEMIADRLGITPKSLERQIHRHGLKVAS